MSESTARATFLVICVRCEREVAARRAWIGCEVGCPYCGSVLRVPEPRPGLRAVQADRPALTPQRFFNFACGRCDVLLEAHTGMSGRAAHCPTCGAALRVPHIDPASGLPLPAPASPSAPLEDPAPLHAYAASGHLAPQIVRAAGGSVTIRCSACAAESPADADRCSGCGVPFTLEAAPTGSGGRRSAASLAALALGVTGLPGVYLPFLVLPAVLALILGIRVCADPRRGFSWLGLIGAALGFVGLSGGVIGFALL